MFGCLGWDRGRCETVKVNFKSPFTCGSLCSGCYEVVTGVKALLLFICQITNAVSLIVPENVYLCDVY